MAERTVKIRAFPYYVEVDDAVTGEKVRRQRIATRGETVDFSDLDVKRGEAHDAFFTKDEKAAQESLPEGATFATMDVNGLRDWLETEKPTAPRTIAAAGQDPALAARLLEAEQEVTGRQPRESVENGLTRIIEESQVGDLHEQERRRREGGSEEESEAGNGAEDNYEEQTVPELQAELEARSLSKSGKKADLVARLREDDADDGEPDDEEDDSEEDDE